MDGPRAQRATGVAVTEGIKAMVPWGIASTSAVWAGHKFHAGFARSLGVSGKVALAISPPFFAFVLAGEHAVNRVVREKDDQVFSKDGKAVVAARQQGSTWHLRGINFFMEHTLASFGLIITPIYGAILHHELSKPRPPTWRFSHAIIHTRVLGQAAAVISLVTVFGLKDFLSKAGAPYDIGDDDDDE